jgi:hypothetical protein
VVHTIITTGELAKELEKKDEREISRRGDGREFERDLMKHTSCKGHNLTVTYTYCRTISVGILLNGF